MNGRRGLASRVPGASAGPVAGRFGGRRWVNGPSDLVRRVWGGQGQGRHADASAGVYNDAVVVFTGAGVGVDRLSTLVVTARVVVENGARYIE